MTDLAETRRWANRITRYDPAVDPETLEAFPGNHRIHPKRQSDVLNAALDELGWLGAVLVSERTSRVVDGHLRVLDAISAGETVPVLYLDLTEEEEAKAVLTIDAIGELAVVDPKAVAGILDLVTFERVELVTLTQDMLPKAPEDAPEPKPDNPVVWGYVTWGKNRRIDSSSGEVEALDAAYETYVTHNGSEEGFIASLLELEPESVPNGP